MIITAIEPISEMCSSQCRKVFSTGEIATILNGASLGPYVMVIALDTLEEETRKSLERSK